MYFHNQIFWNFCNIYSPEWSNIITEFQKLLNIIYRSSLPFSNKLKKEVSLGIIYLMFKWKIPEEMGDGSLGVTSIVETEWMKGLFTWECAERLPSKPSHTEVVLYFWRPTQLCLLWRVSSFLEIFLVSSNKIKISS